MSQFTVTINTDSAAFVENDLGGAEVARILRDIAVRIEDSTRSAVEPFPIRDYNGNTVGHWEWYVK
jgi:hypothetical protein